MKHEFTCIRCKQHKVHESEFSTGYALTRNNRKVCFACCALDDAKYMDEHGLITLYLDTTKRQVTNWPGTLVIPVDYIKTGNHNIAGKRYDAWFNFHNARWHGVQFGENTQLIHCRQLKRQ